MVSYIVYIIFYTVITEGLFLLHTHILSFFSSSAGNTQYSILFTFYSWVSSGELLLTNIKRWDCNFWPAFKHFLIQKNNFSMIWFFTKLYIGIYKVCWKVSKTEPFLPKSRWTMNDTLIFLHVVFLELSILFPFQQLFHWSNPIFLYDVKLYHCIHLMSTTS